MAPPQPAPTTDPLLDDLAALLHELDLVPEGFMVRKGFQSGHGPHRVIALFRAAGSAPEGKSGLRYPAIQARVRTEPEAAGVAGGVAGALVAGLHRVRRRPLGPATGAWLVHIIAQGEPTPLGRDAQNRPEYVQNFSVVVTGM